MRRTVRLAIALAAFALVTGATSLAFAQNPTPSVPSQPGASSTAGAPGNQAVTPTASPSQSPCPCVTPSPPAPPQPQTFSWSWIIYLVIALVVGVIVGFIIALLRRGGGGRGGPPVPQEPPVDPLAFGATGGGEHFAAGAPNVVGE